MTVIQTFRNWSRQLAGNMTASSKAMVSGGSFAPVYTIVHDLASRLPTSLVEIKALNLFMILITRVQNKIGKTKMLTAA